MLFVLRRVEILWFESGIPVENLFKRDVCMSSWKYIMLHRSLASQDTEFVPSSLNIYIRTLVDNEPKTVNKE